MHIKKKKNKNSISSNIIYGSIVFDPFVPSKKFENDKLYIDIK